MDSTKDRGEPRLYLNGDQPTIYRKRRLRWKPVLKWGSLALLVVLVVLFILAYVWVKGKESGMRVAGMEEVLDPKKKGQPVTTLVMGLDRGSVEGEDGQGRTDIIMLVSVNPSNGNAAVISIPRDTRVNIPGRGGTDKINAAHMYGGPELAVKTVREFTGLDINHYVIIDFEGFKHIVDAIGGVDMHIDVAIDDKYAGEVPAGDVKLNGDQALALVRARHDPKAVPAGDLDRIKNQRKFLQAMLSTISRVRNPFKAARLVDVASQNIQTDLTFFEMLSLGRKLQGAGESLQMTTAPGEARIVGGVWYYIVDEEAFEEMITTFRTRQQVKPEEEQQQEQEAQGGEQKAGTSVMVLNGTGVSGLAAATAEELRQDGFGRVETGNAETSYSRTTIYYSDGKSSEAGLVAASLAGAGEPLMEKNEEFTSRYGVDAVVVLGSDYEAP